MFIRPVLLYRIVMNFMWNSCIQFVNKTEQEKKMVSTPSLYICYFGKNAKKKTKNTTKNQTIGLTSFAFPTPIIVKA